mmetsp:Transcript_52250/g.168267  ORF Transcript_52250/g.168267 Transcript_52250/m.168267 type:complete len:291 (-) Transcript_52250:155-1027(-)
MKNIIDGMATAYKNKMNFGGTVPVGNIVTEHGHNFRTLADGFFGAGATESLFIKPSPEFAKKYNNVPELEQHRDELKPGQMVFMASANGWAEIRESQPSDYYSKEVVELLQGPIWSRPLPFFDGRRPSVALHLRRGDLKPDDARATKNEYYYTLLDHIKHHWPEADVHAWSSLNSYSAEVEAGKFHWKTEDFDGFRERGVTVHLDGLSLLEPWVHMARADVFIMSVSSFSFVPATLNPHCVIYCGNLDRPFSHWINGLVQVKQKAESEPLNKCLARRATGDAAAGGAGGG